MICLVHNDKEPWAATFRARALANEWNNVKIVHAKDLTDDYDVIHFLYSGGITKSKEFILKNKDKVFTTLASQRTLDEYWDNKDDLREIYRETVCCVCQNKTLLDKYRVEIGDNAVYIPNGVDTDVFRRDFVAGYVGAKDSAEHKGLPIIRKACDELGIKLKQPDGTRGGMIEFYRSIDCLVLASQSEGCNNPTLEALAMNVPVISTRVGIAEELEGVILVERNVESITRALRKLSGRIQILEDYTWKKTANKYHQLYVEKLGAR